MRLDGAPMLVQGLADLLITAASPKDIPREVERT